MRREQNIFETFTKTYHLSYQVALPSHMGKFYMLNDFNEIDDFNEFNDFGGGDEDEFLQL